MGRRFYAPEFKHEAVKLVLEQCPEYWRPTRSLNVFARAHFSEGEGDA
jgi:transposase-like protein